MLYTHLAAQDVHNALPVSNLRRNRRLPCHVLRQIPRNMFPLPVSRIRRLLRPDQFWRYLRARLGQRPLLQMVPVVCPCYCQVQYQLRFRRHAKRIHVDAGHCPILVFIERSSRRRNSLGKTGCLEVLHRIQPWRCEWN